MALYTSRASWTAALILLAFHAHPQTLSSSRADAPLKEVQIAAGIFSRADPLPAWVDPLPIPRAESKAPVVVTLADTHLRVDHVHTAFVSRAIQVNDPAALGRIGQYPLHFVPQYQRIRLHAVRIIRGTESIDHTQKVDVRFLDRESRLEQGIYSGVVTAVLLIDDVRVGDTLHVMHSTEGSNPVFGSLYSEFAGWDQAEPVEHRRVTIHYPNGRTIDWRMHGDFGRRDIEPTVSVENGVTRIRFEHLSLPGVDHEPYVPPNYAPYRYLQFSEFRNWNAVARWAHALYQVPSTLPPQLVELVARLRFLPDDDARVSAALQWVQSEIRYFSVSLGESSHRPSPPSVVLQRRYGDCKDKSFVLMTLLRELGIVATPVLVSTRYPRAPLKDLPTPLAFDHVIVRAQVGEAMYYLDPTRLGQRGKLSRMGQALDGAAALVVAPDTTNLTTIGTAEVRELVRNDLEEVISLTELGGDGELSIRQMYFGLSAEALRVTLSGVTPEQLKKSVIGPYERRYPGITLIGEPRVTDDEATNMVIMAARFRVPKISSEIKGDWIVRFGPKNFAGTFAIPPSLTRKFPVVVPSHPYEARYSLEVLWPERVSVVADPSTQSMDGKYFRFEISRSFRGNRARVDLSLRTKAESVAPSDLQGLLDDMKKMDRLLLGYVAVARGDIKDTGFLGLGKKSLQETIRSRLQDAVDRTTATIQSGRLQGSDLANAYCDRAETRADQEKASEGLQDAEQALRLAPSEPRPYECRASVLFAMGDFAGAVTDYSKALSLGSTTFSTFYRRGQARFYLGKLEDAAEDFAKASANNPDRSDKIYVDLWLAWTLKRLEKPLPTDLTARIQEDSRGEWPRPALALIAGVISPDEMLDLVNRKQGDEREMALAEAWFYLGQHYLLHNQPSEARRAFANARGKEITMYIEHVAAGFELKRLETLK